MKALDFIKVELQKFILNFPKTKVKVEVDEDLNSYYLEIIPNDTYHFDENYIAWENSFLNKFVVMFPQENLFFISDDSILKLDDVCFEISGTAFEPIPTINSEFMFSYLPKINIVTDRLDKGIPIFNKSGNGVTLNNFQNLVSNSHSVLNGQVAFLVSPIIKNSEPEFNNSFSLAA